MAGLKTSDIESLEKLEIMFLQSKSGDFVYWEAVCGEFYEMGETKVEALENLLFDPMLKKTTV